MNGFDLDPQNIHLSEWLSTRVTFDFVAIMNCFYVYTQITWLDKWFSTRDAIEIFLTFMFLICFFRSPTSVNAFPQGPHLKFLWPLWIVLMCFFRYKAWVNALPQGSHFKSLLPSLPSWMILMWFFRELDTENDFPQKSHLWSLQPSWKVLMWILR